MISAKEKAIQLVDKFMNYAHGTEVDSNNGEAYTDESLWKKSAKQCAIICVDEILDSYPHTFDLSEYTTKEGLVHISIENVRSNMGYWQEVKNEIEKL
jgi:hypothetical protein